MTSKPAWRRALWRLAACGPHLTSYRRQAEITERFATYLGRGMQPFGWICHRCHRRVGALAWHTCASGAAPTTRVLVVGSGTNDGLGLNAVLALPHVRVTEFDIYPIPGRQLVADAHAMPFRDGAFDVVIAQGVLEHVLDPHQVVAEIVRVSGPRALVFITVPWQWGVHMERHDFTRWSRLGLIRLLRAFEPLEVDVIEGVAAAAAVQLAYLAFAVAGPGAKLAKYAVNLALLPLRWLDGVLRRRPASIDAALSYYYIGRKAAHGPLSDATILTMFTGAGLCPW